MPGGGVASTLLSAGLPTHHLSAGGIKALGHSNAHMPQHATCILCPDTGGPPLQVAQLHHVHAEQEMHKQIKQCAAYIKHSIIAASCLPNFAV